jgi:hypothetical protein
MTFWPGTRMPASRAEDAALVGDPRARRPLLQTLSDEQFSPETKVAIVVAVALALGLIFWGPLRTLWQWLTAQVTHFPVWR